MKLDKDLVAGITVSEPLIGYFLAWTDIREDAALKFAIKLHVSSGRFNLLINPRLFNSQPSSVQMGLVLQQYLHCMLLHASHRTYGTKFDRAANDIAQKMAINPLIKRRFGLPDDAVLPGNPPYYLPENMATEFYFSELVKDREKFDKQFLEQLDESSQEGLNTLSSAASEWLLQTNADLRGDCSGGEISCQLGLPTLASTIVGSQRSITDWRQYLSDFVCRARSGQFISSNKRPSRRLGLGFDGKILKLQPHIAVILDTSLSMADRMSAAIGEILELVSKAKIKLYQCDSAIQNVAELGRASEIQVVGFGGTDLQPAFDLAKEDGSRYAIAITDKEFDKIPNTHDLRVLWVDVKNETKISWTF